MKSPQSSISEDVITSAIRTEDFYSRWHQQLAIRFRPFDRGVSCLFELLAEEDKKNKQELLNMAGQVIGKPQIAGGESEVSHLVPYDGENNHFFVVSEQMAMAILDAALHSEREAQRFYERCSMAESHPLLRDLYRRLSLFEEHHAQVLEESMDRFHADSDLRMLKSIA